MTVTTTLKLPEGLKERIAPIAAAQGKTPHAWMVSALQAQVALADLRADFIAEARTAAADIDRGGPLFASDDVAAYLKARAAGHSPARPAPQAEAIRRKPVAPRATKPR